MRQRAQPSLPLKGGRGREAQHTGTPSAQRKKNQKRNILTQKVMTKEDMSKLLFEFREKLKNNGNTKMKIYDNDYKSSTPWTFSNSDVNNLTAMDGGLWDGMRYIDYNVINSIYFANA